MTQLNRVFLNGLLHAEVDEAAVSVVVRLADKLQVPGDLRLGHAEAHPCDRRRSTVAARQGSV